jgi:predicted transcriptional regulator of viral defense system
MKKDLAGNVDKYTNSGLPVLTKTKMEKIGKTPVHRHNSLHHGAYKNVKGKCLRISTIGRTFLDMLKNPDLCGGMAHVLDVYAEHAETYLRLIVDEVTSHGGPIDKVRAGYILDERLGLKDPIIDVWVSHAQRGGSRKLDATAEYVPEYSEKWCLSINLF